MSYEKNTGDKVTESKVFSELIGGGVERPASITLMGGPGTGKTYVALNFVWEGLRNGETCVHICASQPPRNVRRTMRSLDWDFEPYEEEGKLIFVDAYPGRVGKPDGRYYIEDPYDTTLYGGLLSALKEDGVNPDRIVFDSLTSLCSQFEPGDVMRVLKRLQGYMESLSAVGLFVGEKAVFTVRPRRCSCTVVM